MIAKRKGGRREAESERSVEQTYEPMNKNRIRGIRRRTSWQMTTKSISIKGTGCNSTVACGTRSNLPREICGVSWIQDLEASDRSDRAAEVSRGHSVC